MAAEVETQVPLDEVNRDRLLRRRAHRLSLVKLVHAGLCAVEAWMATEDQCRRRILRLLLLCETLHSWFLLNSTLKDMFNKGRFRTRQRRLFSRNDRNAITAVLSKLTTFMLRRCYRACRLWLRSQNCVCEESQSSVS